MSTYTISWVVLGTRRVLGARCLCTLGDAAMLPAPCLLEGYKSTCRAEAARLQRWLAHTLLAQISKSLTA